MTVRDRIVAAAQDRFHALGYAATGVQEIVDLAGVPKGSFYNYFKAKELLALEVLQIYLQGARRDMLSDTKVPPLDRLKNHFEAMASRYETFGYGKGCLIGNMSAEVSSQTPLLQDFMRDALRTWTALLSAVLAQGQAEGAIRADRDAGQMARFLIDGWEGAIIRMKLTDSRQALDDFFEVMFSWLKA